MEGPLFNYNLTEFIEIAAKHSLFVNLRIGPYVCAEWVSSGKVPCMRHSHESNP
jgi:hypothetical protein